MAARRSRHPGRAESRLAPAIRRSQMALPACACGWALPKADPGATTATICVLLQLCTIPVGAAGFVFWPLPWSPPKPVPVMVTCVPGNALDGITLVIVAIFTWKGRPLDQIPPCCT